VLLPLGKVRSIEGISKFVRARDPSGAETVLLAIEPVSFTGPCAKTVEPYDINAIDAGMIVQSTSITNTFFAEDFNLTTIYNRIFDIRCAT